jgi:hypothetical protein
MTSDRIRALWKKMTPFVLGAALLGTAGGMAARHYLGHGCCAAGSSCCFPGSPCCHGHGAAGGVAQR